MKTSPSHAKSPESSVLSTENLPTEGSLGPRGGGSYISKLKDLSQATKHLPVRKKPAGLISQAAHKVAQEHDRRVTKYGHHFEPLAAQSGAKTLLEKIQVLDMVREDYHTRAKLFLEWKTNHALPAATSGDVILLQLLDFLDELFLSGAAHSDGAKIYAAVQHLVPQVTNFPAESSGTEGGALPVIFHESNIVVVGIYTELTEGAEI